jgi:thymidylate kinase
MQRFLVFLVLIAGLSFGKDLQAKDGSLIVFAGISGSGKSSMARELAKLCHAESRLEPEEVDWPYYVKGKQPYGEFSAYNVFRAMRVYALWEASKIRDQGGVVFVDSYYDKITSYYLGKPGMEWLISPQDPYYSCVEKLTLLDKEKLPDADCVVLFDISYNDWIQMLASRGRIRDSLEGFQESYALYRGYIKDAVSSLCVERNIRLVVFRQEFSSVNIQAQKLLKLLEEKNILKRSFYENK